MGQSPGEGGTASGRPGSPAHPGGWPSPSQLGAAHAPMPLGEQRAAKGVAKELLAALCLASPPVGLPAARHRRSLPAALHGKWEAKPPTKHFCLLIFPNATPQPDGPVPCSAAQAALHCPPAVCQGGEEEEEEEEEQLWGQPGVRRSRGSVPSPLQRGSCTLSSRKLQELLEDPIKSRKVPNPAKLKCETVLYGALIQCPKKIYTALFCPEHS